MYFDKTIVSGCLRSVCIHFILVRCGICTKILHHMMLSSILSYWSISRCGWFRYFQIRSCTELSQEPQKSMAHLEIRAFGFLGKSLAPIRPGQDTVSYRPMPRLANRRLACMKTVKDNTKMRGGQNYHASLTFGSPKAHTKLYLSAQRLRAKACPPGASHVARKA